MDPRRARVGGHRPADRRRRVLDVLIRNGWVADGTGSPPFLGDVAVEEISLDDLMADSRFDLAGWMGPPSARRIDFGSAW